MMEKQINCAQCNLPVTTRICSEGWFVLSHDVKKSDGKFKELHYQYGFFNQKTGEIDTSNWEKNTGKKR